MREACQRRTSSSPQPLHICTLVGDMDLGQENVTSSLRFTCTSPPKQQQRWKSRSRTPISWNQIRNHYRSTHHCEQPTMQSCNMS